jgi:hypothetical protein
MIFLHMLKLQVEICMEIGNPMVIFYLEKMENRCLCGFIKYTMILMFQDRLIYGNIWYTKRKEYHKALFKVNGIMMGFKI